MNWTSQRKIKHHKTFIHFPYQGHGGIIPAERQGASWTGLRFITHRQTGVTDQPAEESTKTDLRFETRTFLLWGDSKHDPFRLVHCLRVKGTFVSDLDQGTTQKDTSMDLKVAAMTQDTKSSAK